MKYINVQELKRVKTDFIQDYYKRGKEISIQNVVQFPIQQEAVGIYSQGEWAGGVQWMENY